MLFCPTLSRQRRQFDNLCLFRELNGNLKIHLHWNLGRSTLLNVLLIGHWLFVLIVGSMQKLGRLLIFFWGMDTQTTSSWVVLNQQYLNLTLWNRLVLLNVRYMISYWRLGLLASYLLIKSLGRLCTIFTLSKWELDQHFSLPKSTSSLYYNKVWCFINFNVSAMLIVKERSFKGWKFELSSISRSSQVQG